MGRKMEKTDSKAKVSDLQKVFLFLAFLAPLEMTLIVFAGNVIYPFGSDCILTSDLREQYMPFFQEFVRKLKAGEGLAYSWNIGMGTNFQALYGNYLASPLNWFVLLFPTEHIVEFITYLIVFKTGLAGLSSYAFLKNRSTGNGADPGFSALLFSCFYAMSGFMAAYYFNIMWLDGVILAPLILWGLDRLIQDGRIGLYVIALAACILSNFYISIMICLFLVLYFIMQFLTGTRSIKSILLFSIASLMAGGMAAILLVPEAYAFWGADLKDEGFPKRWKFYFSVLQVLARHSILCKTTGK